MCFKSAPILLLTVVVSAVVTATASYSGDASSSPGIVARVYFADWDDLNELASDIAIWEVNHEEGHLLALLSEQQHDELVLAGYRVELAPERDPRLEVRDQRLAAPAEGIPFFPCYRTVEETYADLATLATTHPTLAEWQKVGESWEKAVGGGPGFDLFVLRLTNQEIPGPKPVFVLMAAIHAEEMATAELAARFAEDLVARYDTDADATWLLDHHEVHVLAHANPDGRKIAENIVFWRKNIDNNDGCTDPDLWGTDLNRNFSFQWGGEGSSTDPCNRNYRGPSAASEPETQSVQLYLASVFPDQRGPGLDDPAPDDATGLFLSLHSAGGLVLFPYAHRSEPAPNDAELRRLGRKFGYFNGYEVCQIAEPGCLYVASGGTGGLTYGELGVASYAFELGINVFANCDRFENLILPDNLPALYYAAKAARVPYRDPLGPDTVDVTTPDVLIVAGQTLMLTATSDDTRYDSNGWGDEPTQEIAAARYSIDTPLWSSGAEHHPMQALDGAFDSSVEEITANVDTTGLQPGRHILFVESQDALGNWGVDSAAFFRVDPVVLHVNSTADELTPGDGQCTLREAIINTNTDSDTTDGDCPAGSGADEIVLQAGNYFLGIEGSEGAGAGDLNVTDDLTINGSLTGLTVIDARGIAGVLDVRSADLSLHDVVVSGGRGGISVQEGALTLTNSTVRNNDGCSGGGIGVFGGTAILRGSTVSDNTAICHGPPLGLPPIGEGGGIYALASRIELINSTVSGNVANSSGGGVRLVSFSPEDATLLLHNSTVADNIVCDGPAPCAAVPGSGVSSDSVWTLSSSILDNFGENCLGSSITSGGHNIDSDDSCGLTDPTDLPNTDPMIGPLQDNDGPTLTHAPLRGSPAIDAIPMEDCLDAERMPLLTDQRGVERPQGSSCDIGAVEVVPEPTSLALGLSAICTLGALAWRVRRG
jgi:CSLREA domain-containing protein